MQSGVEKMDEKDLDLNVEKVSLKVGAKSSVEVEALKAELRKDIL